MFEQLMPLRHCGDGPPPVAVVVVGATSPLVLGTTVVLDVSCEPPDPANTNGVEQLVLGTRATPQNKTTQDDRESFMV
jgi:hypothetical protein